MAFRLYLVPVIGVGTSLDPRRPKYVAGGATPWAAMDYGNEPSMIVGADLSPTDDAALAGQPDVTALPVDLSPLLTPANVTAVQAKLEAAHLPAGWVNTTRTWRDVVRIVLGIFSFLQRYAVVYAQAQGSVAPSVFTAGVTLDTTFGSLPAAVQTALTNTAISFGIATTGLMAGTTVRAILKAMADVFVDAPFVIGGVSI